MASSNLKYTYILFSVLSVDRNFTLDDISGASTIEYEHDDTETTSDVFSFYLLDGQHNISKTVPIKVPLHTFVSLLFQRDRVRQDRIQCKRCKQKRNLDLDLNVQHAVVIVY